MTATKFLLDESEMPTRWYNVIPDLPEPPPPVLHPGTLPPVGPDDLAPLFPMDLILQEVTTDSYVDIPGPVLDVYRLWRPSPLYRAHRLEKALGPLAMADPRAGATAKCNQGACSHHARSEDLLRIGMSGNPSSG